MKTFIKPMVIAILLLSCTAIATGQNLHRCTVFIEHATPDNLVLELWSTSRSTTYSVNVNCSPVPCRPWTADGAQNWVEREELVPGLHTLSWTDLYDEGPTPGMEACINWTCQPEVVVIYWSQDYQAILDYLFLPLVGRQP